MAYLNTLGLGAGLIALAAIGAQSNAAPQKPTVDQEMASAGYLIGNWSCAHQVGTFSGTYKTSFKKVLGGKWLEQTYYFPAQVNQGKKNPASTATALMGYDEGRQTWVRFFANSHGQYFPIRMTDSVNGWAWKYSTLFIRKNPETPGADAAFTRKSDREYVIEGPTYPLEGTTVTEHHVCKKQ
jgi:hypothetical protein